VLANASRKVEIKPLGVGGACSGRFSFDRGYSTEVELPSANASAKVKVLINNVPLRKPMDLFERD
jgi:hypothetical protein